MIYKEAYNFKKISKHKYKKKLSLKLTDGSPVWHSNVPAV